MMLGSFLNTTIGKIRTNFDFQKLSQKLDEVEDKNVSQNCSRFYLKVYEASTVLASKPWSLWT